MDRLTDASDDVTDYTERTPLDTESHAECAGIAWTVRQWGDPEPVQVCTTPDAHHPRFLAFRATVPVGGASAESVKSDEDRADEAEARKEARRVLIANDKTFHVANVSTWATLTPRSLEIPDDRRDRPDGPAPLSEPEDRFTSSLLTHDVGERKV